MGKAALIARGRIYWQNDPVSEQAPGEPAKVPWYLVPGAALLGALAMFAASRLSGGPADAELTVPHAKDSAAIKFRTTQEAAYALMPNLERTIALSTFKGVTGLQVGVRLSADTEMGKRFIGKVTAIGAETVTVRVESWEDIRPPRK